MAYSDRASAEKKLSLELDFSSIDNSTHTSEAPASVDETPYRKKIFPYEIKIVLEKTATFTYSSKISLILRNNNNLKRPSPKASITLLPQQKKNNHEFRTSRHPGLSRISLLRILDSLRSPE